MARNKKDEPPRIGAYWEGRLSEWLQAIKLTTTDRHGVQDWSFPTADVRELYLDTLASRSEAEVMNLLRLFLFESGSFGADDHNLKWFSQTVPEVRSQLMGGEYYKRLLQRKAAHPGIRWALDLLPGRPRLALSAVRAYLVAHWTVLPDGRIDGLEDAAALIRAWFIGFPVDIETKRLSLYELSPRNFERLVERLYNAMEYETLLTPPKKDGGRDILATRPTKGLRDHLRVECKLHADPIGVGYVRSLLGVVTDEKANKGVLAAGSHFTKPATEFADRNPRLELIKGVELVTLLDEYLGSDWPSKIDLIIDSSRRSQP